MGANIYWVPVEKKGVFIPVNAPSSFLDALREAFHDFPVELDDSCFQVLRGMKAVMKHEREAFEAIEKAIADHGTIRIDAEW